MQRRKIWSLAAVPIAVVALGLSAVPAHAATSTAPSTASAAAADDAGYVVVDPSDAEVTSEGTFYPTGPIDENTVVVIPNADGSLPGGLTQAKLNALYSHANTPAGVAAAEKAGFVVAGDSTKASTSATTKTAAAPAAALASHAYSASSATEWSRNFAGPNIIGASETAKVYYKFGVSAGTSQTNAGQGLGYYRGYNGSTFGTWSKFYNVGSADKNTQGGANVSWGNVAAQAQFRAKCATSTICGGTFTANGQ